MKVEEAKTKWCPMVRITIAPQSPKWQTNRLESATAEFIESRCIASECMMWRWDRNYTAEDIKAVRDQGYSLLDAIEICKRNFTDMSCGYCGIGGNK